MAGDARNLSSINDETRPAKSDTVVSREIAGETILVPIKSGGGELDDIFTLNEVATFVWNLIDGDRTISQIAEALSSEFDVDAGESLLDTKELIASFYEADVLAKPTEAASP